MNAPPISYRPMRHGEESSVAALAIRVFDEFVAPDFVEAGIREFHRYAAAEQLAARAGTDHFVLLATESDDLVGMIEVRGYTHVAMLFVARPGRGIGRELLHRALQICRQHRPDLLRVTVHSGPSAVPFYQGLGFRPAGAEQEQNGIRFVPMTLELSANPDIRSGPNRSLPDP